ncbi:MAG: LysM peptidoglycan-binding domain-containing protein [Microthrixaceae bacterium]
MVFIAGLIVIALASLAFGASSVATQKAGQPVATETIVVGSGQTLWDIASDIAAQTGEEDVRDVMHEIKQLNALESGMLMAGQLLRVPAAGADAGE